MTRKRGTVRTVNDKGYGFIRPDDANEPDHFLHASQLSEPDIQFDERLVGCTVEFETEPDPRGKSPQAVRVVVVT
jgi:CspA family cold shock protein